MEATVFNPIQMYLLKMFSYDKSLGGLEELKEVLYQYYSKRMNEKLDKLSDKGPLDQKKLDEIAEMDIHSLKLHTVGKLVLDTNCLIQSIPQRSRYHILWESFVYGKNRLCVSNEILEEYVEILQRLTDNETAEYVVKIILNSSFTELITPFYHFNLITADPDDNKFVGVSRGHYNMMLLAGIMEILSATIKEMRVGPSQSVYRNRLQTITSCVLSNQKVVNVVCNK